MDLKQSKEMDVHTKQQRSFNMSRVRSKNTKPELVLFKELKKSGIKFEKHYHIPGNPDAVLLKENLAIFVDGEFWHGKDFNKWKDKLSDFWVTKISENIKRDKKNNLVLKNFGWRIIRAWGRSVNKNPKIIIRRIKRLLKNKR